MLYNKPMKSILALVVVLIIGFSIGSFTNTGNSLFNFLNKDKTNQLDLNTSAKEALADITANTQKQTGAVFDKQYLDTMIIMYEGSVTLSKIGTVASGRPELRSTAKTVSRDDAAVLEQLKKWRKEWFPENTTTTPTPTNPPFIKK